MVFRSTAQQPDKDTGWGLIFRLNDLLNAIEELSIKGDYDGWNFKLDRIWTNLAYREALDIEREETSNKIISMELNRKDTEEKNFIDNLIVKAKKDLRLAQNANPEKYLATREYKKAKNNLYNALLVKDIWIRKLMHKNNLYIKELKSNPAGAMFGR